MSLRTRVAVIAAVAVAFALVVAGVTIYATTARTLVDQVDDGLRTTVREVAGGVQSGRLPAMRPGRRIPGRSDDYVQVLFSDGRARRLPGQGEETLLPVTDEALAVARGERGAFFQTVEVDEVRVRVLSAPTPIDAAVQVARSLGEIDASLDALRRRLLVVSALGSVLAAGLGLLVARRALEPVRRLSRTVTHVGATQDLSTRIAVDTDDEVGRLAAAFNEMMASLEQARRSQEQLVADASHELRTPLTSLRTNIEVLASGGTLDQHDRRRLLSDVVLQLDEFGRLVDGLVQLARGERRVRATSEVAMDDLVEGIVARARSYAPNSAIDLETEPLVVRGESDRLERAVSNLVDNALKYGAGGTVTIRVSSEGRIEVADQGPGIPEAERDKIFDRFYRAPDARQQPGSGLGLAIVRQVAEAHGGTVSFEPAASGPGSRFVLRLPPAAPDGRP